MLFFNVFFSFIMGEFKTIFIKKPANFLRESAFSYTFHVV